MDRKSKVMGNPYPNGVFVFEYPTNKPEEGKQYLLIGGTDQPSIANGNTWAESEIKGASND